MYGELAVFLLPEAVMLVDDAYILHDPYVILSQNHKIRSELKDNLNKYLIVYLKELIFQMVNVIK